MAKYVKRAGASPAPALFTDKQNNEIIKNTDTPKGQPQGIAPTNVNIIDNQNLFTSNIVPIMQLNEYGQIAYNEWLKLPERFKNIKLDVFQIMPNHMHGIIVLNDNVEADLTFFTNIENNTIIKNDDIKEGQSRGIISSIGNIVGSYKSLVANKCLNIYKTKNEIMGKLWQRNYYEHIIRNEQSYQTFSEYIINNPLKWQEDKFYTK